jgi:D-proline reductase (dithiol) PrdB
MKERGQENRVGPCPVSASVPDGNRKGATLQHGGMVADSHELSLALRTFLKTYPWRRIDPVPGAVLTKPLTECRVALVTSAGLVVPGDEPFSSSTLGGDSTFRVIPSDIDVQTLEDHHRSGSYSHEGIEADGNLGLPLDRLREMAAGNHIGSVAPRHISLMGSITAPGRFVRTTVPEVADRLVSDEVDVALLVPV